MIILLNFKTENFNKIGVYILRSFIIIFLKLIILHIHFVWLYIAELNIPKGVAYTLVVLHFNTAACIEVTL